ncbi:MAG: hypothetical protein QGF80_02565 [Pelagibacteraceae bacterium]|jgi:hypothetical protein|nr:hypothetical protein [Pelagibacteraceae bacterium]MDP6710043.1 hypothetical protein [Pelagibacteraceae bacterium]|tara:strand:+ start:232 stop:390 length:159 start_codon:yes stop_codon:yes gene_type:complete
MDGPINPLIIINTKLKEMFVDPKNKSLGWFDLGNHILLIGFVLFIILIIKAA